MPHICELQVNVSIGTLTIDFGGMDKYTHEERARNLREAMETYISSTKSLVGCDQDKDELSRVRSKSTDHASTV